MQLLYASGFLFMGATEEQMHLLSDANVTHVSYILILYSVAFLLYLFVNILLYVYASHVWPEDESNGVRAFNTSADSSNASLTGHHNRRNLSVIAGPSGMGMGMGGHAHKMSTLANGDAGHPINGTARLPRHRGTASQQVRDAEEFELEGLISDEDIARDEEGVDSPTAGSRKKEGAVALV